jgi:hypothetical protein
MPFGVRGRTTTTLTTKAPLIFIQQSRQITTSLTDEGTSMISHPAVKKKQEQRWRKSRLQEPSSTDEEAKVTSPNDVNQKSNCDERVYLRGHLKTTSFPFSNLPDSVSLIHHHIGYRSIQPSRQGNIHHPSTAQWLSTTTTTSATSSSRSMNTTAAASSTHR